MSAAVAAAHTGQHLQGCVRGLILSALGCAAAIALAAWWILS